MLKGNSVTIAKLNGEYRVNYKGGREDTAYYTNDREDAEATADLMREALRSSNTEEAVCLLKGHDIGIDSGKRPVWCTRCHNTIRY